MKPYIHTEKIHNTRSAEIIIPIIINAFNPKSILDVGCGTGTWLKVFKEIYNINDTLGLDGNYIDLKKLVIDEGYFTAVDLRKSFELNRKYDVVLCLEVAEHLPESSAEDLISSLCKHSDMIIFSAAIPAQGGQNHVNEQWPQYWEGIFKKYNYKCYDIVRPQIWNDERVDVWYKQHK